MSEIQRRKTRQIRIGEVAVGGGAPISVQSMTKTHTRDVEATLEQIARCAEAGCDIMRVAVPTEEDARALTEIVARSPLPIVADIHFDHRLALAALEAGVQGLRLNPGNIRGRKRVEQVARAAGERGVPIRVGVNVGSLPPPLRAKVEAGELSLPEAMGRAALEQAGMLEEFGFTQIKIALKASDVSTTLAAYRALADRCDYPFHVGITEAGPLLRGTVKSTLGIGALVMEGLVDTLRVSLTAPPEDEVKVGRLILQAAGALPDAPELISCPTCGRLEVDLRPVAAEVERLLENEKSPIRIAVMGCPVNGPGEAGAADVGLAAGKGFALIFRGGKVVRRVPEAEMMNALREEIERFRRN